MGSRYSRFPKQNDAYQFYLACQNGETATVESMLSHLTYKEINQQHENGRTPLHAACCYGNKKVVELLLERGADRTIENHYKLTAFEESKANREIRDAFKRPETDVTRFVEFAGTFSTTYNHDDHTRDVLSMY
ncbi:unnamed protein product [Didymodactylos carnosus]|uniref:Uncharacterized protein n=1 Tax=Didymodactylos carnosus TaxID=1234261 RepID=A0A814NTZ6_9BILA|nr:unnamed protein product [Didymodactylos carnosus]CAF3863001.1 unnamed protein product [Didymodactylos carnosus]